MSQQNQQQGTLAHGSRHRALNGNAPPQGSHNSFGASRLPNTPYRRPQLNSGQGQGQVSVPPSSSSEILSQLLDEVHRGLDEQRKVKEDVRRVGNALNRVEENVRQLSEHLDNFMEQSFSIESSSYKDGLIKEAAVLYTSSLKRLPSREDIGRSIIKVLQQEGRNKMKFNKAKSFINNRLTDLRSEERRRVFGNKPCEVFPTLTTSVFAERFIATIKAPDECARSYTKHLALLRKFIRSDGNALSDTFKKFRKWLDEGYALGSPSNDEWEAILQEDEQFIYDHTPSAGNFVEDTVNPPLYEDGVYEEIC